MDALKEQEKLQYELNPADIINEEDLEESMSEMSTVRKTSRLMMQLQESARILEASNDKQLLLENQEEEQEEDEKEEVVEAKIEAKVEEKVEIKPEEKKI